MDYVKRFDFIIDEATSDDEVKTCKEFVAFHSFNVNGVFKQLRKLEEEGWKLAGEGKISYGVMMGSLNFKYDYDALENFLEQKNPHWRKVGQVVRMAEQSLENGKERLEELLNEESK